MGWIESLANRVSRKAVIAHKRQIAAHTFHISLQLETGPKPLSYTPGEHLRLLVGLNKPVKLSDIVRTYSVWNYDSAKQTMDIAVCTFSSGVGAEWAKQAAAGDTVHFSGPKGKFTLDDSGDNYILIGDISALAHLYGLARHLSPRQNVFGIVYAQHEEDFFADLNGAAPLAFHTLADDRPVQPLIERAETMLQSARGKSIMYIGGDGRVCAAINQHFRPALREGTLHIKSKPFWYPGKTGLE